MGSDKMSPREILRAERGRWLPFDRWLHLVERAYVQGTLFELPGFTRRPTRAEALAAEIELFRCPECGKEQSPQAKRRSDGRCAACEKRAWRARRKKAVA
jgi:hypothetical protein